MSNYRAFAKNLFYRVGLTKFLDTCLFRISKFRNRKSNAIFQKHHPQLIIPPDYFLYETYLLNYEQYFLDGQQSAKEIIEWTSKYLPGEQIRILDFGCGVSRIVIHLNRFLHEKAHLYGCDVNEEMIKFNKSAYRGISYTLVPLDPPSSYEAGFFDLVYAISIFTHIRASLQDPWLKEIHRILKENGIFLMTTHGKYFYSRLLKHEKDILDREGIFTKEYGQEGHRMMSTYHSPENFKNLIQPYFEILEFYDASIDSSRTGGQDLWIVRRK